MAGEGLGAAVGEGLAAGAEEAAVSGKGEGDAAACRRRLRGVADGDAAGEGVGVVASVYLRHQLNLLGVAEGTGVADGEGAAA